MFNKKTMRGVPTSQQDLEVNEDGYYVYGQNIKRQYDFKVLWDKGYLHEVDSRKPLIAYTSSVGEVGVINESFYRTGDNGAFQGLIQKDTTNHTEYGTIYLLTVLKKLFVQFGYNTSMRVILDLELELPVLNPSDTTPYWDYMAYFIHNIQQHYADQLEAKSEYELNLMCQILGVTSEDLVQRVEFTQPQYTNTFKVDELFEGYAGKRVKKGDWEPGNIPYVTATVTNNGIDGYIGNPIIVKENLLTVNFFGDVFYQEGKVSFKDGTYGLKLRNKSEECKDVYLVLATYIQKQTKQMGSYDDGLRLDDIKNIILELPVIAPNSKQIDWDAIRHVAVGGGVNYLATRQEICNRGLAIIRQLIQ